MQAEIRPAVMWQMRTWRRRCDGGSTYSDEICSPGDDLHSVSRLLSAASTSSCAACLSHALFGSVSGGVLEWSGGRGEGEDFELVPAGHAGPVIKSDTSIPLTLSKGDGG